MYNRIAILTTILALVTVSAACTNGNDQADAGLSAREQALQPRQVTVIEPSRADFSRSIRTTGALQPKNEAVIRALASGPITVLTLDVGDYVEKGDVLFAIRPADAELNVRVAEAALLTAQANLGDLRAWRRPEEIRRLIAQVDARRAEAERLRAEKERSRELFANGTIPASEWDGIRASVTSAEASLTIAEEDLAIAKAGPTEEAIAVAEARVAEARAAFDNARKNLDDTRVTAPFSGFVTERYERQGGFANRGEPVLRISDVSVLEAEMYIPERFARDIAAGQAVTLSLQSNGDTAKGVISRINPSLDPRTRNFLVKVMVDNSDFRIKAGSFALGSIELDRVEKAISIPRDAILRDEGRAFVWVVEGETARQRNLSLGGEAEGFIEIRSGLDETDRVILEGRGGVTEGALIEILG